MKTIMVIFILILSACATTDGFYSTPQSSSRITDVKYVQDEITKKIEFSELDENLSRFYSSQDTAHISVIPLTGALIDSVGFLKSSKDDYNRYEYRKIADTYKAYLFNKVSCFYVFLKSDKSELKNYEVHISNIGENENKAMIKSEQEYESIVRTLNEIFSKTYKPGSPRSVETSSIFSQDLVCGNKIDFKKPFAVKFKSNSNDKTPIDLYWL
ncbi:MAG: hypothetical protein V4596_11915 [Bdellovibrionota bacterium]